MFRKLPMLSAYARSAIVLGLLTAVGPFAIDMYLPALPAIAADFNATPAAVQGTLIAYFLAVAVCQIVYGPLSDAYGRKAPLYVGMALYVVGALACSVAPSIGWLLAGRFVQGVGGCAGLVIPRAVVRDLYRGHDSARMMALMMLVFSVSPILAPLFGSVMVQIGHWRLIFVAVSLIGLMGLALTAFVLDETRPPEQRLPMNVAGAFRGYLQLLGDRNFIGVVLIGAFGMASFFAYLASSSFVYIDHFGLTPAQYSIAFAINAVTFIGVAQLTGVIGRRLGLKRMILSALVYYLAATLTLVAITLAGVDNVFVLIGGLLVSFAGMGLVIPSAAALALENHGPRAGSASALMGTLQLLTAAVVIGIVGAVSGGTVLLMLVTMAICAVVAFALGLMTLTGPERVPAPAE